MNREFYATDHRATRVLLHYHPPIGRVVECCAGKGDITKVLRDRGYVVWENDLYEERCNTQLDINYSVNVKSLSKEGTSLVTNPPFTLAWNLLESALAYFDYVALYLPINFLEPTEDRWNNGLRPPNHIIVLPRLSHTDDGKKDKKTCFWGVWNSGGNQSIRIVSKQMLNTLGGL